MPIVQLEIQGLGPFDQIDFEFDEKVNVFTGPNNSGKSTALMLLADLLVYPYGIPEKLFRSAQPAWKLTYSFSGSDSEFEGKIPNSPEEVLSLVSKVGYTCYIPALRASTNFRSSGPTVGQNIDDRLELLYQRRLKDNPSAIRILGPDLFKTRMREILYNVDPEFAKRLKLLHTDSSFVDDQQVIQRLINLDYAAYRQKDPIKRALIEKVALVASEITTEYSLTYLGVEEDEHGLFPQFETPDGKLPLNVLSQGTQSLIQSLGHILFGYAEYYNFAPDYLEKPGVVIVDEIDAHLHPSWQQGVLPALTNNFPNLQFFCSTHSPLTLAGLEAGQVQLLRRGEEPGIIEVRTNESDISGWTADEILRGVLGVRNPTDLATAKSVMRLQELRQQGKLSPDEARELDELRHEVNQQLFDGTLST